MSDAAEDKPVTRRQFLGSFPGKVAAGLAAVAIGGGSRLLPRRRSKPPSFPEGSIFTPVKNPRKRT